MKTIKENEPSNDVNHCEDHFLRLISLDCRFDSRRAYPVVNEAAKQKGETGGSERAEGGLGEKLLPSSPLDTLAHSRSFYRVALNFCGL